MCLSKVEKTEVSRCARACSPYLFYSGAAEWSGAEYSAVKIDLRHLFVAIGEENMTGNF